MGTLEHIHEATYKQLDELVEVVKRHWDEICERPMAKEEMKTRRYWEEVHRNGRLIVYKTDHNKVGAFISLLRVEKNVAIDVFFIDPALKEQGIELKILRMAERIAVNWSAEQINCLFSGKEEITKKLPIFQLLGYVLHCPMDKKGFVLLEKKFV